MVSRWGHFFSRVRHRDVLDRKKVPELVQRAARTADGGVVDIAHALSGRPVHRELLRSVLLDVTPNNIHKLLATKAMTSRDTGGPN